jgi:anti-sigma B factor antagonist
MDFRRETATTEGTFVISLFGEFDLAAVESLDGWEIPEEQQVVEIDLSGIKFMDSTGLRELIKLEAGLAGSSRTLRLRSPGAPVMRLFEITGLTERFTFVQD